MNPVETAGRIIADAEYPVILTGAGISAESGVPTFRGKDGLWRKYRPEQLATPDAFFRDPALVWEWYDWRRQIISRAEPNPGHIAISELERIKENSLLITQNVDGLHRKAGNRRIIELHGNLWRLKCIRDGRKWYSYEVPLKKIPPECECGAIARPDVVWFGETIPGEILRKAYESAEKCDVMLVVGTSAVVQPAASLPVIAVKNARIIEINPDSTPVSDLCEVSLRMNAGKALPEILRVVKKHLDIRAPP